MVVKLRLSWLCAIRGGGTAAVLVWRWWRRAADAEARRWCCGNCDGDGGGCGSCAVVCGTSMVAKRGAAMAFWFARSEEVVSGVNEEDDGEKMEVL